ncbi:MAG: D-allulose-6-phosphate 3-epimerase [Microgenomates bacterium OLB23]|nr:MAG: D-allulose-6-phosphate 3-epimerase [Microgenomates bacterium OLB23]
MNIYPSLLETDPQELSADFARLLPHFDYVQIDIADGILVPNKTVKIADIKALIESPYAEWDLAYNQFEFHLMVQDYASQLKELEELESMYIPNVFIHYKALQHTFDELSDHTPFEVGIALNPDEFVETAWDAIKEFSSIQLMTVTPGQQGNPFVPEVLQKITQLRERGYEGAIILDGGINEETLKTILQQPHLPDGVCPGSYFKADNVVERLNTLHALAGVAANQVGE